MVETITPIRKPFLLSFAENLWYYKLRKDYCSHQVGTLNPTKLVTVIVTFVYCEGSGCCSVGRVVASDTRGQSFGSSHRQNFYIEYLYSVNCIEKTEIKKKRLGMAHFKKPFVYCEFLM